MERALKGKLPGGLFVGVSRIRSQTMSAIRGKHNKTTEGRLRMALIGAGINGWKLHPAGILGKPDVFFPSHRVVVFVDGCFWHGCPRCGHTPKTRSLFWKTKILGNRKRDRKYSRRLRIAGFRVVRIWEHSLADARGQRKTVEKIRTLLSP